jgi:hypothetical protein
MADAVQQIETRRIGREEFIGFCLQFALAIGTGALLAPVISRSILVFVCFISGLSIHQVPPIFREVFGPFFWLSNVVMGLVMNRYARHRSALWIGVIGVVCIVVVLAWDYIGTGHSGYYRSLPGGFWGNEFREMFTSECSASECLGHLITVPSLSLITYSIGAWLGLRVGSRLDPVEVNVGSSKPHS